MKIIEKIEIKYFRSFGDKIVRIDNLKDLNIFSGGNDSGKSNVLRALNLFFNNEISPGVKFNFDRDFSKFRRLQIENEYNKRKEKKQGKEVRKGEEFFEIKVYFNLEGNEYGKSLPKKFWITKKWTKKTEIIGKPEERDNIELEYIQNNKELLEKLEKEKGKKAYQNRLNSLKQSKSKFLNQINFFYVPAIKDRFFFKDLYGKLQRKISSKKIDKAKDDLQNIIREETESLFKKFEKNSGIKASFFLEDLIFDFARNIDVETEGEIPLIYRGDGIQALLIPSILVELSDKKYNIWGFEEPENSYEYKKILELRDKFYKEYSKKYQIFITTHSKEFLSLTNQDNENKISIYRVYKDDLNNLGKSKIVRYDEKKGWLTKESEVKKIFEDLGQLEEIRVSFELERMLRDAKLSSENLIELKEKFEKAIKEREDLEKENKKLKDKVTKLKNENKIIIYCENKNANLLNKLGFKNIIFLGSDSKTYAFDAAKQKGNNNIFALIDRDFLTDEEKKYIEENTNVRLFDYYCFENYLYHPENLKEFYDTKGKKFNIISYTNKIIEEFKSNRMKVIMNISSGRQSYGNIKKFTKKIYNENQYNKLEITNKFEEFYKYFSMKDYCTQIKERQNISPNDLIRTNWFKNKIKQHIKSMGINIEN